MKNLRDRLQSAPLGGLFVYFAVVWFVITFGISLLDGSSKLTATNAIIRAVAALLFAGVMTGVTGFQRGRNGGLGLIVAINRAVRSGKVPEDAEPGVWGPLLDKRRRETARSIWLSPLVFVLFAALSVYLIVSDPTSALSYVLLVFFLVFAVALFVIARRQLVKIDALLVELRDPAAALRPVSAAAPENPPARHEPSA